MSSFTPPQQDHRFDSITVEELQNSGFLKWSLGPDTIGAWVAEADFGTAPAVTVALADAIAGPGLAYLPAAVRAQLQEALAGFLARHFQWKIDPTTVYLSPDVLSVLDLAINHLTDPGTPILIPTPAYMPFRSVPRSHGRQMIEVPMIQEGTSYRYDLEALERGFAAGAQLLVLCNPHNPIGKVLSKQELLEISDVVARHGGRVFADEIHAPLLYDGHQHIPYASISQQTAEQAITAISASKAFNLPGLKCAQMIVSNPHDIERWPGVARWIDSQASTIGAYASIAAYQDSDLWLADVVNYLSSNLDELGELVAKHLPGVGYRKPQGTYLAWLDFTAPQVAARFGDKSPAAVFAEHGVTLTDGADCGTPGFVRLNAATPRPILRQIVARLGEVLAAQ